MFDTFQANFHSDPKTVIPSNTSLLGVTTKDHHLDELLIHHGGMSFNHGIYRLISLSRVKYWDALISEAFPAFSNRVTCFGIDWLGRVFSLDLARLEDGYPGILMFEPGTAEVLEIPCNVISFHENELIQYQEEALSESFYQQWLAEGGSEPTVNQCIGYKKPLFLGGKDTIDNLCLSDLEVYWTISAQLIRQVKISSNLH